MNVPRSHPPLARASPCWLTTIRPPVSMCTILRAAAMSPSSGLPTAATRTSARCDSSRDVVARTVTVSVDTK
jgi:hypothetical protein